MKKTSVEFWHDYILQEFETGAKRLNLVADPDGLFTAESLISELRERGFDIVEFADHLSFRYIYELKYREPALETDFNGLIAIFRSPHTDFDSLPFDILQKSRKLSFSLGELFPNLSYPVLEKLPSDLLTPLFAVMGKIGAAHLGDEASMDFILLHLFELSAVLIDNEAQLLKIFLRLHYGRKKIPRLLQEHFCQELEESGRFKQWPLPELMADENFFFAFLQERWPRFLQEELRKQEPFAFQMEPGYMKVPLVYPGPEILPFGHDDVKIYMDSLFLEGRLKPASEEGLNLELLSASWLKNGIAGGKSQISQRINRLFVLVEEKSPGLSASYHEWTDFARKWAELSALVHGSQDTVTTYKEKLYAIGNNINAGFAEWLKHHYAGLINQPPQHSAMVHHVPRRMIRELEDFTGNRTALIVVDGLSLEQWVTVRHELNQQYKNFSFREYATFAWIPTLTAISRQALFAGKPPVYFGTSLNTTDKESALWEQFWSENNISRQEVFYRRSLGSQEKSDVLQILKNPEKNRVLGLVVDTVDKIMHGMQLGMAGMHNQIKQWMQKGYLCSLLLELLENGYQVWLSSDHGNIECLGCGRPAGEGTLAEVKGERARIYTAESLRSPIANSYPQALQWSQIGLPANYFALLMSDRQAFANNGASLVCHGGIAIEEVILPLIRIERVNNGS